MSDKPIVVKGATVKKVDPKNKVTIFTLEKNGKDVVVKGWQSDQFVQGLKEGTVIEDHPEIEKKTGQYGEEMFFKSAPKGGGSRGGGQAKSDPAKNAIIQSGNHLNNATACMQMAVQLLGPGHDVNAVRTLAFDLAKCAKEIAGTF